MRTFAFTIWTERQTFQIKVLMKQSGKIQKGKNFLFSKNPFTEVEAYVFDSVYLSPCPQSHTVKHFISASPNFREFTIFVGLYCQI